MSTVQMTLQEALAKKKILESDISKKLSGNVFSNKLQFVTYAPETATNINGIEKETFIQQMKANLTSVKHLISNLTKLKVAINASNAVTKITIAGKEYTVADAIARYRALDSEKGFYSQCASQYNAVLSHINSTNEKVNDPDRVSAYMSTMLTSDTAKKNETLYNSILEDYKKNNIVYLLDPNNLQTELVDWADELATFESEIHTALVTSNVNTTITVEFDD